MARVRIPKGFTGVIQPQGPNDHYTYCVDGERVPSVTAVLSNNCAWGSSALQWWAWDLGMQGKDYKQEMKKAANAGTLAHEMVEHDCLGIWHPSYDGYSKEDIELAEASFEAFLKWKSTNKFKPLEMERSLVSATHKYGGTFDIKNGLRSTVQDRLALVDIKTSKAIYLKMWVQIRAYGHLIFENDGDVIDDYYILRIGRDGSFEHAYKPKLFMDDCWEQFQCFLKNEHFTRKWGKK